MSNCTTSVDCVVQVPFRVAEILLSQPQSRRIYTYPSVGRSFMTPLLGLTFAMLLAVCSPFTPRVVFRASRYAAPVLAAQEASEPLPNPAPSGQPLPEGAAIELWHEGTLHVGNFLGQLVGSSALRVQLSSGELIKVDGGQLVDAWPAGSYGVPTTSHAWQLLKADAAAFLADLPPHMLDLRPLWLKLIHQLGGCKRVDSTMVAAELFTRRPQSAKLSQDVRIASEVALMRSPTPALLLAQRLSAAQLLGEERTLFKRQPGQASVGRPPLRTSVRIGASCQTLARCCTATYGW